MLKVLAVTGVHFSPVTTYNKTFDTDNMSYVKANAQSGNIPAITGNTEFVYIDEDLVTRHYVVSNSLISVQAAIAGAAGTVNTGSTVEEYDDNLRRTKITITAYLQAVTNANKGYGKQIYTFPAGFVKVISCIIDIDVYGSTCTATPEIGIGTVVGTGNQATLGAIGGTTEDIRDGVSMDAITTTPGTAYLSAAAVETDAANLDGSATPVKVFLNYAAAWGVGENLTISGTVELVWTLMGDV